MSLDFEFEFCKHLVNEHFDVSAHSEFAAVVSQSDCRAAYDEISKWPGYQATNLIALTDIAEAAGVSRVYYKDESTRFGLGSFKALGGSYAVAELAQEYQAINGNLDGFALATAK